MRKITTQVSSDVEYERLIVEVFVDSKFIGLVTQERPPNMVFEFPTTEQARSGFAASSVDVETLQRALLVGVQELKGRSG